MAARSTYPIATIHIDRLRNDVVAVVRGQENGCTRKIILRPHTTVRDGFADQTLFLANPPLFEVSNQRIHFIPHRSVNDPGGNSVHIDSFLDQGQTSRLSDADYGGFAG